MTKYTGKWCNENLNAKPMTWGYVKGEVLELVEAIQKRDRVEAKEEIHDVAYTFACALHTSTGISLPLEWLGKPSVVKFEERIEVWKQIFESLGLVFKVKYLENGSNYKNSTKLNAAIWLAAKEQHQMSPKDIGFVTSMQRIKLKQELYNGGDIDNLMVQIDALKKAMNIKYGEHIKSSK